MSTIESPALAALRENRPEIFDTFEACAAIMAVKAHDYADTKNGEEGVAPDQGDSYRNLRGSEALGIPAWKGVLIRIQDKMARLANFALKGELKVKDESFHDTVRDAINYLAMMGHLFRQASGASVIADSFQPTKADEEEEAVAGYAISTDCGCVRCESRRSGQAVNFPPRINAGLSERLNAQAIFLGDRYCLLYRGRKAAMLRHAAATDLDTLYRNAADVGRFTREMKGVARAFEATVDQIEREVGMAAADLLRAAYSPAKVMGEN